MAQNQDFIQLIAVIKRRIQVIQGLGKVSPILITASFWQRLVRVLQVPALFVYSRHFAQCDAMRR